MMCVATQQSGVNQTDPSGRTKPEATDDSGPEYISKAAPYLRRGVESGAVTATVGVVGLLSGLRAFLAGERTLGLAKIALGGGFLTAALAQWRSRNRSGEPDVEETEVGDTDAIADAVDGAGEEDHDASKSAVEIADTSPDMEDVEPGLESDADTDTAAEAEDIERLGEAAFDSQSREVPAPQQAFNRGFLSHSSMVCWGIRARDGAVLIAQDYDALAGRDGVKYVASSEIGTDVREIPIPEVVLNHWDEVIGGGMAVTGGDDILFVTTESLAAEGLLCVLPTEWADNLSE